MMRMENAPLFTGGNRGGVYTFGAVLARLGLKGVNKEHEVTSKVDPT